MTGAASGIGRATVLQFVADGIRQIALNDISEEGLKDTASLITVKHGDTKAMMPIALASRSKQEVALYTSDQSWAK